MRPIINPLGSVFLRGFAVAAALPALLLLTAPSALSQAADQAHALTPLVRMQRSHLEKARADVAALKARRQQVKLKTGYSDLRCVIHAHSYLSHDSRGKIEEIAAACKQDHIDAIFISDHPQKLDVVTYGKHGVVDGVLFVPGSEVNSKNPMTSFAAYPGENHLPNLDVPDQQLVDEILASKGMIFVVHPEGRADWSLKGLTGMELYNTHANLMSETALLKTLQPHDIMGYARVLQIFNVLKDYPRELFASIQARHQPNFEHYDALCKTRVIAATAGNDSHQNVGVVIYGTEDGKYRIADALDKTLAIMSPENAGFLKSIAGDPIPGKELYRRQLDPYYVSLGYVSTHVLSTGRTEAEIRKALAHGRSYVGFDWMCDPTGTAFVLESGKHMATIGDSVALAHGMRLRAETPLACSLRLVRDGKTLATNEGRSIYAKIAQPGIYRMEASVTVDGEPRDWIYTGAIRVTPR